MPAEDSSVVIRVQVVDGESGIVLANLYGGLNRLGQAGAAAGQQIAQGMAVGAAGINRAAKEAAVNMQRGFAGESRGDFSARAARMAQGARARVVTSAAESDRADALLAQSAAAAEAARSEEELNAVLFQSESLYSGLTIAAERLTAAQAAGAAGWRNHPSLQVPGGYRGAGPGGAAQEAESAAVAEQAAATERHAKAMAAYEAASKKAADGGLALAAAFDAATAEGLGFEAAMEKALTVTQEVGLSTRASSRAVRGMGSSFAETEVIAGAMGGSMHAMEYGLARMVASTRLLGPLMEAVFAPTLIFAGAAMLYQMGESAYNLYEKYISLSSAAEKYQQQVEKTQAQDFGNARSIETITERVREASDAVKNFQVLAHGTRRMAWGQLLQGDFESGLALMLSGPGYEKAAYGQKGTATKLTLEKIRYQHEINLASLNAAHAYDSALEGRAKIQADLEKRLSINAENRSYNNKLDQFYGNSVAKDAGAKMQTLQDEIARGHADAEEKILDRERTRRIAQIREQSLEAGLKGPKLYAAQEAFEIKELARDHIRASEVQQSLDRITHEKVMAYYQQEKNAIADLRMESELAGASGISRLQIQEQMDLNRVNRDRNTDPQMKQAQDAAIRSRTQAQILQSEKDFANQILEVQTRSVEEQLTGYARMRADALQQKRQLQQEFNREFGTADLTDPRARSARANAYAGLQSADGSIDAGLNQRVRQMVQQRHQQTEQLQLQSQARMLSAQGDHEGALQVEYEAQTQRYKDELKQQLKAADNNFQLIAAANEEYNAKMLAADQQYAARQTEIANQARRRMASEFSGFFRNPLRSLEEFGTHAAGNAAASLVQGAENHFNIHPQQTMTSWWNRLAGAGSTGSHFFANAGVQIGHAHTQSLVRSFIAPGKGSFSLSTATIYVGNAMIAGGADGKPAIGAAGRSFASRISGAQGNPFPSGASSSSGAPTYSVGAGTASHAGGFAGGLIGAAGSHVGNSVSTGLATASTALSTAQGIAQLVHPGASKGLQTTQLEPTALLSSAGRLTQMKGMPSFLQSKGFSTGLSAGEAGLGLFSAYRQGGGGGALTGAMSGAKVGAEVGGPIGAAIGAIGGAALGFFGGGEQARVWWIKQGRTRLNNDLDAYNQGTMDYLSAYMDIEALRTQAKHTLNAMGFAGKRYLESTVDPALNQAEQKLTREQKAGRSAYAMSSAQFDVGSDSVPRDGLAFIHQRERIIPSDQNERITRALEGGAPTLQPASESGEMHFHLHTLDTSTAQQWLHDNSHAIRASLNADYARYGGLADV